MAKEKHLLVRPSTIGLGIFTKKTFAKNSILFQIKGKLYHYTAIDKIGGKFQDNTFRFGPQTYLSPQGEIGDFLNHSCSPNSRVIKIRNKIYIKAIKKIPKGTELLIDYSTILADDDVWKMRCACEQTNCRKTISKFSFLPHALQKFYKDRQIVPKYILKLTQ